MTLIECFDRSAVNNIAGCLCLQPEKLILLGEKKTITPYLSRFRDVLAQRGLRTRIVLREIRKNDIAGTAAVLSSIVREEDCCVIDLTGGDEPTIMAVGAMIAGLDSSLREKVSVQKYDVVTGTVMDCDGNGRVIPGRPAALAVQELIAIHGGTIPYTPDYPACVSPACLDPLWKIVTGAPRDWNRSIAILSEFESRSDTRTEIFLPLAYLRTSISNYAKKESEVRKLLAQFKAEGIIQDRSSEDFLNYRYTSPIFRYCTEKAGNVLELKCLLEAQALQENGAPFFQDCRMSVTIDWDGVVHEPEERVPETRNEIDLILTRGMTPLFISCKNGVIGDDELYKLNTVASRFGGPYARKMLIATDLDRKSPTANRAFIQRAWDMDILLVTDAAELSKEEWQDIFVKAMQ